MTLCEQCYGAVHSRSAVAPTADQEDDGSGRLVRLYSAWKTYRRLQQLY